MDFSTYATAIDGHRVLLHGLFVLTLFSLAYVLFSGHALRRLLQRLRDNHKECPKTLLPRVSLLKPLCGMDHELYQNLRSFCVQDYPDYQIIFGIHHADDPAGATVRRLIREFPHMDIRLVVEDKRLGVNAKASNLASMARRADHDLFIISDSDIRVAKNFLRHATSVFSDPDTGAASCLYRADARPGIIPRLGAMYVNDWLLPSAAIAVLYGRLSYCFGATMIVRRGALDDIGGFASLSRYLADDYMLGRLLWKKGWKLRLVPTLISMIISDERPSDLWHHELRWSRTIRNLRPWGYGFSILGDTFVIATAFLIASGGAGIGWIMVATAWLGRAIQQEMVRHALFPDGIDNIKNEPIKHQEADEKTIDPIARHHVSRRVLLLIPLRDILRALLWLSAYFTNRVRWRGQRLRAPSEGRISRIGPTATGSTR